MPSALQTATRARRLQFPRNPRFLGLGDSITAQKSNAKGTMNWLAWTAFLSMGRLKPTVGADQGIGGNTMTQILARIAYSTGQFPDLLFEMSGHNDAFTTAIATLIARKAAIYTAIRSACPNTIIIGMQTLPSTSESTQASIDCRNQFNAWIASQASTVPGRRFICIPVPPTWDPTSGVHTQDGTHPNVAGAMLIANQVISYLTPYFQPADVLSNVLANQIHNANLSTKYALAGTSGTKSGGTTPTGNVATSQTVTNNSTAAVACSKGTVGADATQILDITGTVSAEQTVVFNETSATTLNGVAGDFFEFICGYTATGSASVATAPGGLRGMQAQLGSIGLHFNGAADAANTTTIAAPISGVLRTWPLGCRVATTTANADVTMRYAATTADTKETIFHPIIRKIELLAYAAPFYLGSDGIKTATETTRITGTATNGSTLTCEPGTWSGGGNTYTYQWIRSSGPTNVGSNQTTYVLVAGDVGSTITCQVTVTNAYGSTTNTTAATAVVT